MYIKPIFHGKNKRPPLTSWIQCYAFVAFFLDSLPKFIKKAKTSSIEFTQSPSFMERIKKTWKKVLTQKYILTWQLHSNNNSHLPLNYLHTWCVGGKNQLLDTIIIYRLTLHKNTVNNSVVSLSLISWSKTFTEHNVVDNNFADPCSDCPSKTVQNAVWSVSSAYSPSQLPEWI